MARALSGPSKERQQSCRTTYNLSIMLNDRYTSGSGDKYGSEWRPSRLAACTAPSATRCGDLHRYRRNVQRGASLSRRGTVDILDEDAADARPQLRMGTSSLGRLLESLPFCR